MSSFRRTSSVESALQFHTTELQNTCLSRVLIVHGIIGAILGCVVMGVVRDAVKAYIRVFEHPEKICLQMASLTLVTGASMLTLLVGLVIRVLFQSKCKFFCRFACEQKNLMLHCVPLLLFALL
eukprot:c3661_g1_i1.p1 GENE.c3661_g1_i1~~c3661_g1_i1.p1  ORF type:complete len:124 (-),score=8.50 c3661_g1_i1:371-742(-)